MNKKARLSTKMNLPRDIHNFRNFNKNSVVFCSNMNREVDDL